MNTYPVITLSDYEMEHIVLSANQREQEMRAAKRKAVNNQDLSERPQRNVEGMIGEYVMAKWLHKYICGPGMVGDVDVWLYEVRFTKWESGVMPIQKNEPRDKLHLPFWLVTGKNGRYTIRGWLICRDCMWNKWWGELTPGRPCYCVPQSALRHPDEDPFKRPEPKQPVQATMFGATAITPNAALKDDVRW